MSGKPIPFDGPSPDDVLTAIRQAYLEDEAITVSQEALIGIAEDPARRSEFERKFQREINDTALKRRVIIYLKDVVVALERDARSIKPWVEVLDRYVAPASGAVGVAGLVALTGMATVAAPFLLVGGVTMLGICALSRTVMEYGANQDTNSAAAVKRLIENLEGKGYE